MIKTSELSFQYSGSSDWALKDVNMSVERGECLIFTGPSGCGKSTLVKCLNGLVPHFEKGRRAGMVTFDGKDIAEEPMHAIARRIGTVFQNPRSQFFTTNVIDEIAFGCENMGIERSMMQSRADKALESFGISSLRDRAIFNLSAGERQKVILAAIYAMGPEIWVMDEPSSNLDGSAVESLADALRFLKREGKTIIISEHRIHYLRGIADRIVVMDHGRLSEIHSEKRFFQFSNAELNTMGLRWGSIPLSPVGEPVCSGSTSSVCRLAATGITYRYASASDEVLKEICIEGTGGEIVAVTGGNGTGKTTLAMILCGLYKEHSGTVSIDGTPMKPKKRIRSCKMVFQETDHQLFTESVYRELQMALPERGGQHAKIMETLRSVGMEEKTDERPHAMSGGEKQRLAIAAALVAAPKALVLDEPTSGLDAGNMKRVGKALSVAASRGCLVIVVTHDAEFIHTCCTRVLHMENGGFIHGTTASS